MYAVARTLEETEDGSAKDLTFMGNGFIMVIKGEYIILAPPNSHIPLRIQ